MTQTEAYNGIYDTHPDIAEHRVFFAFSNEQLKKGMNENGYKDFSEIKSAGRGVFGSSEALRSFFGEYKKRAERVAAECDPQKVYDYEYANHECGYVCNDAEAIKIIVGIFGEERAMLVERKNVLISIEDINEEELC